MNKIVKGLFIVSFLCFPVFMQAQRQTEYNRKGDEAMARKNYKEAKFWYEEGVAYCDSYSIDQLTNIWEQDVTMHISMKSVMNKCLNCLIESATANDTISMISLAKYYKKGIGTEINELSANYWESQLENVRNSNMLYAGYIVDRKARINFSFGYSYSPIAPFGVQIGGVSENIGFYIRFRSNLYFQNNVVGDCNIENLDNENYRLVITELDKQNVKYRATGELKSTTFMGSAGALFKISSPIYLSAGIGYWKRNLYRQYETVDDSGKNVQSSGWARDKNNSLQGVLVDVDANYYFSKYSYASLGGSLMSFKYIYPSVGIGVVF